MGEAPLYRTEDHEPLIRVMALHALGYCERLFYLEEVEEIRLADERVYEGRRLHELLPEYTDVKAFTLESETLGIYGKIDCLRNKQGEWIPYEYKKGRARKEETDIAAWPSDELQVAAYTMLLEEHLRERIEAAKIYYASDHRTVTIDIDSAMRQRVISAIERALC